MGRWFESNTGHHYNLFFSLCWSLRLTVRTPPFHGGDTGSNPVGITILFDGRLAQLVESLPYKQVVTGSSPVATTINLSGAVAQLVRVSACHAEGRGFESRQLRHLMTR